MFIDDLRAHWISLALVTAAQCYAGPQAKIPKGPGPIVVFTSYGGSGQLRTQNRVTTASYLQPAAQIAVHCERATEGTNLAAALLAAAIGVRNTTINGTYYREINSAQSEPGELGSDADHRSRIGFNLSAVKRP
jgi:hypothetical protein